MESCFPRFWTSFDKEKLAQVFLKFLFYFVRVVCTCVVIIHPLTLSHGVKNLEFHFAKLSKTNVESTAQ